MSVSQRQRFGLSDTYGFSAAALFNKSKHKNQFEEKQKMNELFPL